MGILNKQLERAFPIVASAYADQFGIKVSLSGNTAMTNGEEIILPLMDNLSELKDVCFGYLAHEAAHIKFTDFSVLKLVKSPIEKSLLNLIEDIRIEGEIRKEFPGTQFTLDAVLQHLFDTGLTPQVGQDNNEASNLFAYLFIRMRGEVLQQTCLDANQIEQAESELLKIFPAGLIIKLDVIFSKYMHNLSSTRECLSIARRILKALQEAEDEAQEESEDNQDESESNPGNTGSDEPSSDNPEESEQSESSTQSNGSQPASSESGESDESENVQPGSSGGESEDEGEQSETKPTLLEKINQETDLPADAMEQIQALLEQDAKENNIDSGYARIDACSVGDNPYFSGETDANLHNGILSSSVVRSRLLGLLQAKTRERRTLHNKGKKVEARRLNRLAAGNSNVFIRREEQEQPSTAMHVLLDNSGSMYNDQSMANQAALSLAMAVSMVPKCAIAVSAFPGNTGVSVCPIIKLGQPVRSNISRFNIVPTGGTPLAEAMLYAAKDLANAKQEKKVLVVVTDGDPDCDRSVNYMNDLIKGHIDCFAIGINSNRVSCYFDKWCVISDVSELQTALFDVARAVLKLN